MTRTYRYSRGVLEGLGHQKIHSDEQVFLLCDLLVPHFDLAPDPLGEGVPDAAEGYVDDELLRQLDDLLDDGHVEPEVILHADVFEDVLNGESLILWARKVLHFICQDIYENQYFE